MKYQVKIELVVNPEEYNDIHSEAAVRCLVREMIDGMADWPDTTIVITTTEVSDIE